MNPSCFNFDDNIGTEQLCEVAEEDCFWHFIVMGRLEFRNHRRVENELRRTLPVRELPEQWQSNPELDCRMRRLYNARHTGCSRDERRSQDHWLRRREQKVDVRKGRRSRRFGMTNKEDKCQLFNLSDDPYETTNMYDSGKHEAVIARLTEKIRTWQKKTNDKVEVI